MAILDKELSRIRAFKKHWLLEFIYRSLKYIRKHSSYRLQHDPSLLLESMTAICKELLDTEGLFSALREAVANPDQRRLKDGYRVKRLRFHAQGLLAATLFEREAYLIPELAVRKSLPLNTWIYQNKVMKWDIGAGERVLDIGSGGYPFSKATHLADMFQGETTHRFEPLKRDSRPFFLVNIEKLPFKDKTWDFVFCSHVLEHLKSPGNAIREIARIGRRGYIEVPTRLSDIMLNFTRLPDHHRWHGLVLGDTLVLTEWPDEERKDMGSNHFFLALHSPYTNPFQTFFEKNWTSFYAMLRWRDRIRFLIIDKHGEVIDRSD